MSTHHVRVIARIRPLSSTEQQKGSQEAVTSIKESGVGKHHSSREPELVETKGNVKRWFELDAVLDKKSTQREVYERSGACQAVCEDIFQGFNATFLAYGQTGSGKTYSMGTAARASATDSELSEDDGMIPRACVDLFRNVQEKCDGNARVELSYLEIYNEEVRDLLSPDASADLKIRETFTGEVYVSGLTARQVSSPAEVGELMDRASNKRVVASTAMNAVSSRSHAICTLRVSGVVETPEKEAPEKFTSKLTLVDLAGSERIKKTGAQGSRRQEGISINKGLFVLGQCVSALAESKTKGPSRKPPYRESKLTRLLQDSLGGNSRTIMVACVSPADFNIDESINTLRYATSARKIKSKATRNIVQNISPEEAAALRRENQLLRNEVTELQAAANRLQRTMSGSSISPSDSGDELEIVRQISEDQSEVGAAVDDEVASLKKQLKRAQATIQDSQDSAMQLPAMKVEMELLREKAKRVQQLEEENIQLRQELDEAHADGDAARNAAAKLSDILDHLKELRRNEIDEKKQDLKYLKKDEAWVLFMDSLLEGRAEQLRRLATDFDLFKGVVDNRASSPPESREGRSWWGRQSELDPELRDRVIQEHTEYFHTRMVELQDDVKEESQSLQQMIESIQQASISLQEEIGNDEMKEEREDRADMLVRLKQVWASTRSPLKGIHFGHT